MIKTIAIAFLMLVLNDVSGCGNSVIVPTAPTGMTVESSTPITLNWKNVSGATSFNVYRGTTSGDISTKILVASNFIETTYTDLSASSITTYYYQVTAVNSNGESSPSNEVTVLGAPTDLTVTSSTPITLSWYSVSGATSYIVYRGTNSGDISTKIIVASNLIVTTYSDSSAAPNTTYYYQVTALNSNGMSPPSNEVNVLSQTDN